LVDTLGSNVQHCKQTGKKRKEKKRKKCARRKGGREEGRDKPMYGLAHSSLASWGQQLCSVPFREAPFSHRRSSLDLALEGLRAWNWPLPAAPKEFQTGLARLGVLTVNTTLPGPQTAALGISLADSTHSVQNPLFWGQSLGK
jgi:hypothetical protein